MPYYWSVVSEDNALPEVACSLGVLLQNRLLCLNDVSELLVTYTQEENGTVRDLMFIFSTFFLLVIDL